VVIIKMFILKKTRKKIDENGGEYESKFHRYQAETHVTTGIRYIAKRNKVTRRSTLFYYDSLRKVEKSYSKGLVSLA